MNKYRGSITALLGALALFGVSINAYAVPSFARQTGLACTSCHTIFPKLTAFGRSFKLHGYTLTGIKQVESNPTASASGLKVNQIPPLSAMLQVNATNSNGSNTFNLPGEFSLFFAGEISPKMGSFIQLTMEDDGSFAMDNTDIRYANTSGDTTYGVTINNNPTVQDLWNSTPVWGFPYTGGASMTQPLIADGLGQNVMGVGGYAQMANGLYTELTLYQSVQPAGNIDSPGGATNTTLKEGSPYARVAWQKGLSNGDNLMVGAYGMQSTLENAGSDKVTDMTVDTQYEHHLKGGNLITAHASYTNEKTDAGAGGSSSATLDAIRADATYHWGSHAEATLGYASNTNAADEQAVTAQFSYLPWQNTKFTAQYVNYMKSTNKDALLLQAWLMW